MKSTHFKDSWYVRFDIPEYLSTHRQSQKGLL